MGSANGIFTLPKEIIFEIIKNLNIKDFLKLWVTNKQLREFLFSESAIKYYCRHNLILLPILLPDNPAEKLALVRKCLIAQYYLEKWYEEITRRYECEKTAKNSIKSFENKIGIAYQLACNQKNISNYPVNDNLSKQCRIM